MEEENVRKKAPRKPQLTKPFNAYLPELATLPVPQRKPLPEEYKALVKRNNNYKSKKKIDQSLLQKQKTKWKHLIKVPHPEHQSTGAIEKF